MVQIENDGPRGTWQLARIGKLYVNANGRIRSTKVKLSSGRDYHMSLKHLYLLECSEWNEIVDIIRDVGDKYDKLPARDENAVNDNDTMIDESDTVPDCQVYLAVQTARN